jgi:hypothetical protein
MASNEGPRSDLPTEPPPSPPTTISNPSAEGGSPVRDPRDVPALGTAQGTAPAADPDEVVPDRALHTSADVAATSDTSGPTAESGVHPIDALATVAKTSAPEMTSEGPSTEGGITHSTGDSGAPVPTPSQRRSVKDTLVFGPSDWNVCNLNPFHIHPGAQIRPVRRTGKGGFDLIRKSILQKTFDVTSLIIVWRDEKQDPAAQPPRFLCVDGMHRVEVVQDLISKKHEDWPLGMVNSETGEIRLQCAVLRETPTRKDVVKCALARNAVTSSVVETTYIDTLASIQAAREVIPELVIGRNPRDVGLKNALIEILQFGMAPQSAKKTLRTDLLIHADLLEKGLYQSVMDLASSNGHEWFSRHAFNTVLKNNGAAFVVSTFKLWLGKQADTDLRKLTDARKSRIFKDFVSVVGGYYNSFSSLCRQLHTDRKSGDACCLGHVDTLQAVREAVFPSISPTAIPSHDDSVITEITAIVGARTTAAFPPVPRLEDVEIQPVPPFTPVPVNIPRQSNVLSKKNPRPQPPNTPRSPPPTRFRPSPPPTPPLPLRSAPDPLLESSDAGRGPSTGLRPTEPTMTLRSRDINKRTAPDDTPDVGRQQPQKRAKITLAAHTTGGEQEAASESSSSGSSSTDSLFDDDASKSIEVTYPSVPPGSAIYRVFSQEETLQWFKILPLQGTAADNEFLFHFHAVNLSKAGYAVIPEVIREDTFLSRTEVDDLFDFSRKAFATPDGKCCASAQEPAFGAIFNSVEGMEELECAPKRCQSNRHSYHQHLETHHEALFKTKLKLDLSAAIIGQFLRIANCSLPKSGGRLLLSEPGCPAQPPHCDYKVRYSSRGTPVSDGSYFMMHSGRDGATVLVWPASHHIVTKLDWMKETKTGVSDVSLPAMTTRKLERLGTDFYQQQKPTEVVIPPYSIYVARGDVVHAGAAHNGPEPNVRCHVHLTSTKDKTLNNVETRPFGI